MIRHWLGPHLTSSFTAAPAQYVNLYGLPVFLWLIWGNSITLLLSGACSDTPRTTSTSNLVYSTLMPPL